MYCKKKKVAKTVAPWVTYLPKSFLNTLAIFGAVCKIK